MFNFFSSKKQPAAGAQPADDSVQAMLKAAERQGWLAGRDLGLIPELLGIYKNASDFFFKLIADAEPKMRETLMFHTCRYLFAKGVEGVILWGPAPGGRISVYFHPKHLMGPLETEVPAHLHRVVEDSLKVGESLFSAHQQWVIHRQATKQTCDRAAEMEKTLGWIPKLGSSYALSKQYQTLR